MAQCPPSNLSLRQIETLASRRPGTIFLVPKDEYVTPPDTRTRVQKLYKSAPKERKVTVLKPGTYLGWRSISFYGEHAMFFQLETGQQHDLDVNPYRPDECTGVGLGKMAPLATPSAPPPSAPPAEEEEDPKNVDGGRKRRSRGSRVKKQTRRSQRKRRNTIRK
jgi:hypothetical protein